VSDAKQPTEAVIDSAKTQCVVVGGGPAGMMLSLLLARKGVETTLLESHLDFDRDFRGDTIHPSTLEALDQIGLADKLVALPHGKLETMSFHSNGVTTTVADMRRLKTKFPYVMIMPQARFLDFLCEEAKKLPAFRLILGANVQRLVEENGVYRGVRYQASDGWHEVLAPLTVAADGRFSKIRSLVGEVPIKSSPPMDILWFRLPRADNDVHDQINFYVGGGNLVLLFDRGNDWQVGVAVMKGGFAGVKAAGLDSFRAKLTKQVPWLGDRANTLTDWHQITVLAVESSRVGKWHRPGLLLIGDAAHVMSPVGGVGINYAIQDAIETSNMFAEPLRAGIVNEAQSVKLQARREPPIKMIQRFQGIVQNQIIKTALDADRPFRVPLPARIMLHIPILRDIPAKMIAFGYHRSRIEN
jgi:2-polyprenyl-6-methoxyphenol hydroxylase-like FAD-dependent oxidoreductase